MISMIYLPIIIIMKILFSHGGNIQCDERLLNHHLIQCYQHFIDPTFHGKNYFLEGNVLCRAYNGSSLYRHCLYSIFNFNSICSSDIYPFTYEYFKIYWKLIESSCLVENDDEHCFPSPLSREVINKCHYSFDDSFPTKCKEFLRSLRCLEENERQLIPSQFQSSCSGKKAYYYYYGDLAIRLQLSLNLCES